MNCADFEARLHEQLDASRMHQTSDLAVHAAQCATCRATWEGFRLLSEGIDAWRQQTPDTDLEQAVVAALGQSINRTPLDLLVDSRHSMASKSRRRSRLQALAIASIASLLAMTAMLPMRWRGPQPTAPLVQNSTAQGNLPISGKGGKDLDESVPRRSNPETGATSQVARRQSREPESDRVPYYDLAHRAAGALGQITLFVLPDTATPQKPTQEPAAEGAAGWINDGWIDDVEHRLKPVGRSLGDAFDFLWRAGESVDG